MPDIIGHKPKNYIKAVILAAGIGKRWNNYLGVPKQMIPIGGEPLMLRTIRQLKKRGCDITVTVPRLGYYGKLPCRQLIGIDRIEIDKFLNVEKLVDESILLLWGDTFFTESAMDIIFKDESEWMFFGRKGRSEITGKPWGEIFAVKTNKYLIGKANELRRMAGRLKRCATWELYRLVNGYPLDKHIVEDNFTEINDLTEDFDYPVDYDNWIKRYGDKTSLHK